MTCKEFANKYGIDYNTVYNSSWHIEGIGGPYSRDFDESELKGAVVGDLKRRHKTATNNVARLESMLTKCGEL